jgi:heme-degrading monooxygenase HmoA
MYAVIFEVEPAPERVQEYLDIAARLRPELEKIDGFISVEQFKSRSQDGKILSLSFWRDEAGIHAGASRRSITRHKLQAASGFFAITASASPRWCVITVWMSERRHRSRCPHPDPAAARLQNPHIFAD